MNNRELLKDRINALGIQLTDDQVTQFIQYYNILIEWNKVMNLTGITEYEEVVIKHFEDSLALVKAIDLSSSLSIIDMGTGAGFPGIPLKIAFPKLNIVLMDSLNKRVKFLDEVINSLELSGIKAIHSRAEELGRDQEHREKYDICVSRAVAKLSVLSEYCLPFVKVGGQFIAYKSGMVKEEMNESKKAIHLLGGKIILLEEFVLPDTDYTRSLVCIKKNESTKKKYPRSSGKPSKEPII